MTIQRFEDIQGWQKAREIVRVIYEVSSKEYFLKDRELREQIRSASISIMSNIAEGFDSSTKPEFARFLGISRRSASEVQSQLYIALDLGYIKQEQFDFLYKEVETVRKIITGFIKYLKK